MDKKNQNEITFQCLACGAVYDQDNDRCPMCECNLAWVVEREVIVDPRRVFAQEQRRVQPQ